MIIGEILARNARMYGDEVALVERDGATGKRRELTWKQFDEIASRVANALIGKGVRKGDKVVHLMMNCLEWLPAYFGILRSGALVVPLNFRFTAEDIRYCSEIAEARAVLFGEEFAARMDEIRPDLPSIKNWIYLGTADKAPRYAEEFDRFVQSAAATHPEVPVSVLDDAALYFTSGTTGKPKPILLTQRNLESSCIVENRHHNQSHNDNYLCIPPLYHTGAKMHWFGNFIVGAKAVLLKGVKPEWILQAVSEEQVTVVFLLVPWAQDILIAIESGAVKLSDYKLDQWRLMHIGAQPVPPSLIQNWKKVFPKHDYDTNYGLSESTGPGCVHLGMENLHKVGAIGRPGFDWECAVFDDHQKPAPKGQPGELAVRGPGVMKEYYKNPEATQKTLVNGWLMTGDMARLDEDGFIWLVDRKKDIVITGGENIFPVEIEDFLMAHPSIQDAGVIGIPDERLGEAVAAIIKVKSGKQLTQEDVQRYCEGLPKYKRPKKIFFDEVPRNPTGKIEKPKLRKKYAGFSEMFKI